jgi:cephalosporin hydroxylase
MNWHDIEGWFNTSDARIYKQWARDCPPDCTIIELGTWCGRSASCLLTELEEQGKTKVKVVCIDLFPKDNLSKALVNLVPYTQYEIVRGDCNQAASEFRPESVWAVYLDANHSYENTKKNIEVWKPKIVRGGRMGGHDFNCNWPGVIQAVMELDVQVTLDGRSWEIQIT